MPYGYKKLLSEKQLLRVQQRARALMRDGSSLIAIYYNKKQLVFKTRSGTDRRLVWTQTLEITDATMENILNTVRFKDVEDLIKNSGLKVHCDCPAYLYWGMQYKGTRLGYALVPERRRPTMINRQPSRIPYVCKHLYLVLQLYPFWSKTLASKFKNYYTLKEETETKIDRIDRARQNKGNRDYVNNLDNKPAEEITEEEIDTLE